MTSGRHDPGKESNSHVMLKKEGALVRPSKSSGSPGPNSRRGYDSKVAKNPRKKAGDRILI